MDVLQTSLDRNSIDDDVLFENRATESALNFAANEAARQRQKDIQQITATFAIVSAIVTIALFVQLIVGVPERATHAAVTTPIQACSDVALSILHSGGDAVDAVTAAILCASLMQPHKSPLAGGAFYLLRDPANAVSHAFNMKESYPEYQGENVGARVGVQKTLSTLSRIQSRFGTMQWLDVVNFVINSDFVKPKWTQEMATAFAAYKPTQSDSDARRRFISAFSSFKIGDSLPQTDLKKMLGGAPLDSIAIEKSIISAANSAGGALTDRDFDRYNDNIDEKPVSVNLLEQTIESVGAGGVLLLHELVQQAHDASHHLSATLSCAEDIINQFNGAIDKIKLSQKCNSNSVWTEDASSMAFLAVDKNNQAVGVVTSLGGLFGSGLMDENGLILNNNLFTMNKKYTFENKSISLLTPVFIRHSKHACMPRRLIGSCMSTGLDTLSANLAVVKSLLFDSKHITDVIGRNITRRTCDAQKCEDLNKAHAMAIERINDNQMEASDDMIGINQYK